MTDQALACDHRCPGFRGREPLAQLEGEMLILYIIAKVVLRWVLENRNILARYFWKTFSLAKGLYFIVSLVEKISRIIS